MQMMSFNTRLNWFPCIYTKRVYTFWIGLHTKTISISPVCGPFYSSININGRTQSEKKTHTRNRISSRLSLQSHFRMEKVIFRV